MKKASFEERIKAVRARLQKGIEIELTTIPPYLVAALSIKKGTNVESRDIITSVFMEEMLHLCLAANTLTAVGGSVALGKKNIPQYPCRLEFKGKAFHNREFDIDLARFSPESIQTFLKIELPDGFETKGGLQLKKVVKVKGYTLGDFYRGIQAELTALCKEYGEKKVFSGNPDHQINEGYYWKGGGRPVIVTNLKSALLAIEEIIDQGEGATGVIGDGDHRYFDQPEEVAHYFRFNEIACEQYYQPGDKPHSKPSGKKLNVDYREVYPIKTNCRVRDFKRDERLLALNYSFNSAYSLMLAQLQEGFNGNPRAIYTAIMNGMHKLSPVAIEMMTLPLPGDPKKRTACPTFEWVPQPLGIGTEPSAKKVKSLQTV
jgi:hypothetical protein